MKELQEKFIGRGQVKGFIFTQVKKSKYAFMYKVDTGTSIHYEVFYRKENNHFKCVSYPTDKSFGLWAWTNNLNNSLEKFEEINLRKEFING